jgi:outer membrane protein OmpA-like peptidoglycan-associated protein
VTPPTPPTEPEVPAKPVVVVVPVVTAVEKVLANNVPVLAGTPLVSPILFAADSPKLDATDFAAIKKAAAAVTGRQGMILITGFVKYVGKLTPKIKALAAQRAKNVAEAMAKLGVKVKIGYLGYGPMNTKSPKNTDRKVEMRWVEATEAKA